MKLKIETWVVLDSEGNLFNVYASKNEALSAVDDPDCGAVKAIRMVPYSPDDARIVSRALAVVYSGAWPRLSETDLMAQLEAAVERREKRLKGKR